MASSKETALLKAQVRQKDDEIRALVGELARMRQAVAKQGAQTECPTDARELFRYYMKAAHAVGKKVQVSKGDLGNIHASIENYRAKKGWSWPDYVRFVNDIMKHDLNMAPGCLFSDRVLAFVRGEAKPRTVEAPAPAPAPIYRGWDPSREG